jgi:hypothetical protein
MRMSASVIGTPFTVTTVSAGRPAGTAAAEATAEAGAEATAGFSVFAGPGAAAGAGPEALPARRAPAQSAAAFRR